MTEPRLRIISLGAGVQSTTMALMAAHGEIGPMPDAAIFADTGWEPRAVYEHLDWLRSGNVLPFPVHVVSAGNLYEDTLALYRGETPERAGRFITVPWFTKNPDGSHGMVRRQCTSHYKIEPMQRKVRELLGLAPREPSRGRFAEKWLGISADEAQRMKDSSVSYERNRFPLIEARMSRRDCLRWIERNGYPTPPKSACGGCPFHTNAMWRDQRDNDPGEWQRSLEADRAIRDVTFKGFRGQQFMHRARVPLDQVDLSTPAERGQIEFGIPARMRRHVRGVTMPNGALHLETVHQVIDALRDTCAVAPRMARGSRAVSNWRMRQKLPADTYPLLVHDLAVKGHKAPPSLWGVILAEERA